MVPIWCCMLELWFNRNDFVFNNKIILSPRALIFLSHFSNAALDGGEYRHGQSSAGVNGGGNQVTGA
jgi:hypothetical protein